MEKINLFWFRRDLRLEDNHGLSQALQSGRKVLPVFIFDKEILGRLEDKKDRRVDYIHQVVSGLNNELESGLQTYYGSALDIFSELIQNYDVEAVFCNRDYEPQAIKRDLEISNLLKTKGIDFYDFKDQVIFEKDEILKADGLPYTVYTPYSNKWKATFTSHELQFYPIDRNGFFTTPKRNVHSLEQIGFQKTDLVFKKPVLQPDIIRNYDQLRDFPALNHTSGLGIALRFGTVSVRQCVKFAVENNAVWLSELIWREFFMQILYHFPKVVNHCFKEKYENIRWRNREDEFMLWCEGRTGYPIVDAGMNQLNETGLMHNRVRMITASFLTKHLLIDWRWGETYFAQKLLDYDLSANNGNWQWAAGCGCDAAPYFRVFNPTEQTRKFDKNLEYIRRWNPGFEFSVPMVEHSFARERALKVYKEGLSD